MRELFLDYITDIKKKAQRDIFSVINVTLISNPYITSFPKKFILKEEPTKKSLSLHFIKNTLKFYIKELYLFISYLIAFIIYKIFYTKDKPKIDNETILIDIFFLTDKIIREKQFNENYFKGLYEVLNRYNKRYIFLPRVYGANRNPFKLIEFFKIISKEKGEFLFEFELISFIDFIKIANLIIKYPFKSLNLIQKGERLFNIELIEDIPKQSFDAFSRYIYGANIAKIFNGKIYSWSEFQVVERAFNYGIRVNNPNIELNGCQFYLTYDTYFNTYIDDIDFDMLSSFHTVLVNGEYYILDREKVKYQRGVSLRYDRVFKFRREKVGDSIVLLGSYIEKDTKYMLDALKGFENVIFKNHPAVDIKKFGKIEPNIKVVEENIYSLFQDANIVVSTASGTAVEAVACGVSVIIISSRDNLTSNPLIEVGKGKIWDLVVSSNEIKRVYNRLLQYKKRNIQEIEEIALWYRDNFFIEPTEENIIKAFKLEK